MESTMKKMLAAIIDFLKDLIDKFPVEAEEAYLPARDLEHMRELLYRDHLRRVAKRAHLYN